MFLIAIYYRVFDPDSDVRSRPLQSVRRAFFGARTVVILHMGKTAPEAASEVFQSFHKKISGADFCCRQTTARCTFVRQTAFCPTKVLALRDGVAFPSHATLTTNTMTTAKKRTGRPTATDPRIHRYNFKLTTEENIRFKKMLSEAGLEHNRSRFIVKRIFAERFEVLKRDPSKVQFIARLNDFYFQFQKLANNYNQVVKAINAHFSNVAIPHQIAMLEQRTRELKALSIEILNLAKQAKEWLRI